MSNHRASVRLASFAASIVLFLFIGGEVIGNAVDNVRPATELGEVER